MALDFEQAWQVFKERGSRIAVWGLISAILFAVANKAADNLLSGTVDRIWGVVKPPTFAIVLSQPVKEPKIILREDEKKITAVKIKLHSDRMLELSTRPGLYTVEFYRDDQRGRLVLKSPLPLLNPASSIPLDTSESQWAPELATTHFESQNTSGPANLVDTRWTTTKDDWEVVRSVTDRNLQAIITVAMQQVGVNENGPASDKETIAKYWTATRHSPYPGAPWGGAFLSWVIHESRSKPENPSPSFLDWVTWGKDMPTTEAKPGMLAIFDFPGLRQAPSNLLVRVFVRQNKNCSEIIAGNIANRVVITCVSAHLKSIRAPL